MKLSTLLIAGTLITCTLVADVEVPKLPKISEAHQRDFYKAEAQFVHAQLNKDQAIAVANTDCGSGYQAALQNDDLVCMEKPKEEKSGTNH